MQYVSIVVSVLALISSAYIGYQQLRISKNQDDLQQYVELHLLFDNIIKRMYANEPSNIIQPAIIVRNIGNAVVYLNKYVFNGREYPLYRHVLPSTKNYDNYYYIELPTDGTTHVSLDIYFDDWQEHRYLTKAYADLKDGQWNISHLPCERESKT